MVPPRCVLDEPLGGKAILGVLEGVVHLDVRRADEVIIPSGHRLLEGDDPSFFLVGVDALVSCYPSAAFLVGIPLQPVDDGGTPGAEDPGNLCFVFSLFEKCVRFVELFLDSS